METQVDRPPTREVVLKLADSLGMREKERRRLDFLLAAGVASAEDMEGLTLVVATEDEASCCLQPAIAGTEALGSGVGLGAILSRAQTIGFLVDRVLPRFM